MSGTSRIPGSRWRPWSRRVCHPTSFLQSSSIFCPRQSPFHRRVQLLPDEPRKDPCHRGDRTCRRSGIYHFFFGFSAVALIHDTQISSSFTFTTRSTSYSRTSAPRAFTPRRTPPSARPAPLFSRTRLSPNSPPSTAFSLRTFSSVTSVRSAVGCLIPY